MHGTDRRTTPLSCAYCVPNVSGGLATSSIEQRTDWSYDYDRTLARVAGTAGFEIKAFGRQVLPIVRELGVSAGPDPSCLPVVAAGIGA